MTTYRDEAPAQSTADVRLADFEVVLVTYRSRQLVAGLLAELPQDLGLVVVDNARGADGMEELVAGHPHARYLDGGGVGFARAANRGARTSRRPYLVFVNPDTRPSLEQLRALVADLVADPALAAVAATTVRPDGRVELGAGGWEPTVSRALVYATGLHSRLPRAGVYARPVPFEPVELDWLTGACLAVPRATFVSLGGFDENYFLYNEDMAYGRRIREAGLRQRLRTDVLVPHVGAGSGERPTTMLQMRGASMHDYLVDHNGLIRAEAMRLALSAGAVGRWAVSRLRGRPGDAAGFAAYTHGLWRGAPPMG